MTLQGHRIQRLVPFALVALLLATLVAGCGSSDNKADTGGAGGDAVTIRQASGDPVTVHGIPKRIVALGSQWTDALLAFGVQPVAFVGDPNSGKAGKLPWQGALSSSATVIPYTGAIPFEQVSKAHPDLVLYPGWAVQSKGDVTRLTAGGQRPALGALTDRQVDPWQDQITALGKILHQTDKAAQIIKGVNDQVDALAKDLPSLKGKTYILANYVAGDSITVVADPDDGAASLFKGLGMSIAPDMLQKADGATGRVDISLEQVSLLDADVLLLLTNGSDPHKLPGYDDLAPVKDGAVTELDYSLAVAVNTPSSLSIPYALGKIRPALEAAAK
jgi:iron complex transport system substrate-binding protein